MPEWSSKSQVSEMLWQESRLSWEWHHSLYTWMKDWVENDITLYTWMKALVESISGHMWYTEHAAIKV